MTLRDAKNKVFVYKLMISQLHHDGYGALALLMEQMLLASRKVQPSDCLTQLLSVCKAVSFADKDLLLEEKSTENGGGEKASGSGLVNSETASPLSNPSPAAAEEMGTSEVNLKRERSPEVQTVTVIENNPPANPLLSGAVEDQMPVISLPNLTGLPNLLGSGPSPLLNSALGRSLSTPLLPNRFNPTVLTMAHHPYSPPQRSLADPLLSALKDDVRVLDVMKAFSVAGAATATGLRGMPTSTSTTAWRLPGGLLNGGNAGGTGSSHGTGGGRQHKMKHCPVCNKVLVASSLYLHMKIHTGEKNYICEFCCKRFLLKHHLHSHLKICQSRSIILGSGGLQQPSSLPTTTPATSTAGGLSISSSGNP